MSEQRTSSPTLCDPAHMFDASDPIVVMCTDVISSSMQRIGDIAFVQGAAVAFGIVGMGREIQLREEEKEIVRMQCEMARQWSGDDPGECPVCGDPWEIVRPGKSQATCDCQDEEQRT